MREPTLLARVMSELSPGQFVGSRAGTRICGKDFAERSMCWAAAFATHPGRRFALQVEDSIDFAAALFGAWHAGKDVLLAADSLPATLALLATTVDGFAGEFPAALQAAPIDSAMTEWQPLTDGQERLILYTSGSSGAPMAVSKTLAQLDSEINALQQCFGAQVGDALVHGTVSHQHIYGLLFRVLWPLCSGRPFGATRLGYPEQIASAAHGGTLVLVSSPAQLKRIPDALDWTGVRRSLRTVFCSGGPLESSAAEALNTLWRLPVTEVLGSTETGGIAWRQSSGGAWQSLPGVSVRVDNETLWVRSAHLPSSQWMQTQDRARAIGEQFELLGRSDRLVKLEERRVSLSAIERVLQDHIDVAEARVLMLAGARSRIAGVVALSGSGRAMLLEKGKAQVVAQLRSALHDHVDAIAIPRLWRFVESLPVNSQGKILEGRLATLFQPVRPTPQWIERTPEGARLRLTADRGLAVFDGHFSQAPIVPGVALVDWAIRWGSDAFSIRPGFARMEAVKFQRMVTPGTELDLSMSWQVATGVLAFSFASSHGAHASGRVVFADAAKVAS